MSDIKTTPFHQAHKDAGAKLVDFAGWELPIHYGSQIAEHEAVRTDAGMFDVSHMLVTDVAGEKAKAFFRKLLANDVAKLGFVGKALYSAMLNDQGGVIDDLIVYRGNEAETQYRIVSNGATREKDSAQFQKIGAEFGIKLTPRYDLAMLAVQGPKAIAKLLTVKPEWTDTINGLKPFQGADLGNDWFVARTGYTGEDGVEVILPGSAAEAFFKAVQAGMAWTVDLKDEARNFVGKAPMVAVKEKGVSVKQVGLLLAKGGVLREHMEVITPEGKGITTSGVFSPSLKQSIAIARVPKNFEGDTAKVVVRGKEVDVRVLKLPFVRNGQKQFD